MENLGKLLRRIREERGMTQEKLAELVGVDQAVISIYETGARRMKLDTLARMLAPLGMRPEIVIVYDSGDANAAQQRRPPPAGLRRG